MATQKKRTEQKPSDPVTVAIPNTTAQKMQAIVSTARAIEELAKAINGTNVSVEISNCNFEAKGDGQPGVAIKLDQ